MTRLSDAALEGLPPTIERPRYRRGAVATGVVHLGVGAFHRAHQAIYFEQALTAGDARWGIVGASLRSPDVRDRLRPQDGLYSVTVRDGASERVQVVGALRDVLVAPEDPAALIAALADPAVHLVTLTITEKGYAPAGGGAAGGPDAARLLAAGLALRRSRGLGAFTAISCDNLSANGERLRAAVLAAAEADGGLADWIAANAAFPSTMVDRMVPATTEAELARAAARLGLEDRGAVNCEPFRQWVIEDRFAGQHPDWAAFGVQLTRDVGGWETAKLRLLNGAHSATAYLGALAGIEHVHAFAAQPAGRGYLDALMEEAASTLAAPPELDVTAYRATLMQRFCNPALRHRLLQIAADGSQKLPQRLLAPISARLTRGLPSPALTLAVAGWMTWVAGHSRSLDDPLAPEIRRALAGAVATDDQVDALLSLRAIFPPRLATDAALRTALIRDVASLRAGGVAAALDCHASEPASRAGRPPLE